MFYEQISHQSHLLLTSQHYRYDHIFGSSFSSEKRAISELSLLDFTELSLFLESDKLQNIPTIYGRTNMWKDDEFEIWFYSKGGIDKRINSNTWDRDWYGSTQFSARLVDKPRQSPNRHLTIRKNIDEYFFIKYTIFDDRLGTSNLTYVADQIDGLIEFLSDNMLGQDFPKSNFPQNDYFLPVGAQGFQGYSGLSYSVPQ